MDDNQQEKSAKIMEGYFAAKDANETMAVVLGKADSFFNFLKRNYYLDKLVRMYRAYYGIYYSSASSDAHEVSFGGEQGEMTQVPVNHFRNLAEHIYNIVTSNRPTMEARSINTDYKSSAQTILANGILDYYMREKRLEEYLKRAVEMSIVLGAGFIKMEWNATAGDIYDVDPETNEFQKEGELEFSNLSPFDVVVDGTKETWDHEWVLTRSYKNKYNLIAKYPEFAEKIAALNSKSEMSIYRMNLFSNDKTDDIAVYEFYHKPTDALPKGRYILSLSEDIVLIDIPLPYRIIPIFRVAPKDILGTPYGYSPIFDLYPIQETINSLYSTMHTSLNAFGVQNVFVERNADIQINSLEGGLNVIEGNAAPQPLNLTSIPPELFKAIEMMERTAETISGINSVARGNPQASLESGSALALVQSMSLQFISSLQQSYVRLIEDVGSSLIQILKDFATTPKVVALIGKNNKTLIKEFTGDDLRSINRVIVDVGNPLSRTTAGRVQMAEQLLQMKLVKSPEQYFQILNTGRLDAAYEGDLNQLLLIKLENERLAEGKEVLATALDKHSLHIREHLNVIGDPELRYMAPEVVQQAFQHIQEHIELLRTTDPELLMLIGEQPLQNPMEAQNGQNPPGSPADMLNQQPPKSSVTNAPMGQVVGSPQANGGMQMEEGSISSPSLPGGKQNLPNLPKVDGNLLPNPGIQEQNLNNVK